MMVTKAHKCVFRKHDYQAAQHVVSNQLFKGHTKYEDLQRSELRMEFLRLAREKPLFRESQAYFERHKRILEGNQYYRQHLAQTGQAYREEELTDYDDLLLLYLNCKQNQHSR